MICASCGECEAVTQLPETCDPVCEECAQAYAALVRHHRPTERRDSFTIESFAAAARSRTDQELAALLRRESYAQTRY